MLEQDHHEIELLFDQYDRAGEDERARLIERACYEIEAHTRASQETFYPAVRAAMGDDGAELVEDALIGNTRVSRLIKEIRGMHANDPSVEAKFAVLMELARQHVDEEEVEMFPLVKTNMDSQLGLLGDALEQQKHLFEMSTQ